MKRYAIELEEEDLVIEIDDDCVVEIHGRYGEGKCHSVEVKKILGREGKDEYAIYGTIAFYRDVLAVRCLDDVKRQQDDVA